MAHGKILKRYQAFIQNRPAFKYLLLALLLLTGIFRLPYAKASESPADNLTLFATAYLPSGICVDPAGNVFVGSVNPDNVFQEFLTKYAPDGSIINQAIVSLTGRMEYDTVLQKIWMLADRQYYLVDPANLTFAAKFNISALTINTDNIYDIVLGQAFPTSLDPYSATYSDFDLLYRGNQLDIFVAGYYQAWQFILRIRLLNQSVQSAKVIVTSGASLAPSDNSPHGVAVNSGGVVLTTLGWSGAVTDTDRPVKFGADFPEVQNRPPVYLFDEYENFSSRGMSCDADDNYYVASGWVGGGTAGGGSSCLIALPEALDTTKVISFSSAFANPRDVAVDNTNGIAYLTDADMDCFGDYDAVWMVPLGTVGLPQKESLPSGYQLYQNFPNPFNPVTTIRYRIPVTGNVRLSIYNCLGEKITELMNHKQSPGIHTVKFDGKDLAGGVYFYEMQAGPCSAVKKFILLK